MKKILIVMLAFGMITGCKNESSSGASNDVNASGDSGQSQVADADSQNDVVKVAVGSPDHTTLVAAVKAAGLVDELSNTGPFTVFAPSNAAFDKLPAGTVEGLLKKEKLPDLQNILQYHVYVGVIKTDLMQDGMSLGQVNGDNISITMKDGKYIVNGTATILASVPASNGIVHVIDAVLLPPAAK